MIYRVLSKRLQRALLVAVVAFASACGSVLHAKIDLVTLPDRGDVELTIYNPADLTLVRERRTTTFTEGENQLQFSWSNTLIDPSSVHLEIIEGADFVEVDDINYPANTVNTLVWTLIAGQTGSAVVEITYFTSGISWEADYVVRTDATESAARLESFVRVTNNSGADYPDARTRLLVGEPNLVESIARLAMAGMRDSGLKNRRGSRIIDEIPEIVVSDLESNDPMGMVEGFAAGRGGGGSFGRALGDFDRRKKDVAKEGVSEYYLFTIEGREDLADGLSKRLQSFEKDEVTVKPLYRHDRERYGVWLMKMLVVDNTDEAGLGEAPLPDGRYDVFAVGDADRGLAWLGRHHDKYVPIGDDVELELGEDPRVLFDERRTAFRRLSLDYNDSGDVIGWITEEEWIIEVTNTRGLEVGVELVRHFTGDFDFSQAAPGASSAAWTQKDDDSWELSDDVPASGRAEFGYTITTRFGSLARR